jgi:hypothetical protein
MIIKDDAAKARLNSPMNLINQLRSGLSSKRKNAMNLFIPPKGVMPSAPISGTTDITGEQHPVKNTASTLDTILENNEAQIKLGLAHDSALDVLNRSIDMLSTKLDDIKADRLPGAITAASRVVESIRKERNEASKNNKDREVHYHFYTPEQKSITEYEVIDVG